jgi:ABC-type multidrug transport system fused ATPase/permease subunit
MGWLLVFALFACQLSRTLLFNLAFNFGVRTALRVHGATQYLGYSKLLRLASPNDAALGQLITFFSADMERIHEAIVSGVMFTGGPVMFLASAIYATHLIGPTAFLGLFIILLFYPIMVRRETERRNELPLLIVS